MPIDDKETVLCFSTFIPSEKGEAKVMYVQDYNELNDNKGIGLPAVHAIVTSMDTKYDEHSITAQKVIQNQARDSYYRQSSSAVGLSDHQFTTTGVYSWFKLLPTTEQCRKSLLRIYNHVCYITCTVQYWQHTRWKMYVRRNATRKLLATNGKWRVYDCLRRSRMGSK